MALRTSQACLKGALGGKAANKVKLTMFYFDKILVCQSCIIFYMFSDSGNSHIWASLVAQW